MFPSVQMHQVVQAPHHLDAPSPFQLDRKQERHHFSHYPRHASRAPESLQGFGFGSGSGSTHRAFPIRLSQPTPSQPIHPRPNTFMFPSHLSDRDEHQLRRKTPNGTIDAGYDGNPAQLASGPPPLKHMILPTSSSLVSATAYSQQDHAMKHHIKPAVDDWAFQSPQTFNVPDHGGLALDTNSLSLGGSWRRGFGNDSRSLMALDCVPSGLPTAYYPYNNGVEVPTALQPIYQHSPGPAIFDNGGLLPPSIWPETNIPSYHPTAHLGALNYQGFNHQFMPHPRSSNTPIASRAPFNALARYEEGHVGLQTPSQGLESLTLEPAQYHRPRLGQEITEPFLSGTQIFEDGHISEASEAFESSKLCGFATDSERGRGIATPFTSAKAALEMLTHLCEQSGWKWIDGMLLGGCLHYGLEHYEQSLEWFQRIISLDETHVEAISNVAATLYCLNRHEEAEHHWLRAVRLRPSYLEAVEHLVGLLCSSHRSKEAVDIIDFIQQSTRLSEGRVDCDMAPHTINGASSLAYGTPEPHLRPRCGPTSSADGTEESRLPGFGSSGYCVAGNENGRVIALIHAKGNMLYALKDIDRASESFEEAVLINPYGAEGQNRPSTGPLLLPPERARRTAQLVFAAHGDLPGLRFVPDGGPKRSAISTTSNSLLSLAKIFQDAMSNGGSFPRLLRQPSGIGDILALYYLSLSLSESPSTANNVGILLASVQHNSYAPQPQILESANMPQIPGIAPGSGLSLALAYYHYGLTLDSKHVHLHTNLGSLLKDIGQLDLAIQMYEQAVACDGTFDIALTNLANAVKDRGRISDAIAYYRRAVNSNPDFAEAVCGLSTALNSVCDWNGRGGVVLYDGTYDRWHVDDQGMIRDVKNEGVGSGLMKRVVDIVSKQLADSYHWGTGILQNGALELLSSQLSLLTADEMKGFDIEKELRKWSGHPWEGSRILRLVERSMKAMMRHWYLDKYVHNRPPQSSYPRLKLPASLAVPAAPTVLPFHTFTCPLTANDIRMISQRNAARISCSTMKSPWLPASVYVPPPPPSPHLNIGYVSSDFNNHPLAHLMQSVFGFHNPARAKAFCYATTASDKSVHRLQIEREAPVFRDVSAWSSERLVEQIVRDEIHILVNLNGYTRGARNEIFAARPAPIQMSFMGFAGTLGAEWCDYILADETAIPPSTLRPARNNTSLEDVFRDSEFDGGGDWMFPELGENNLKKTAKIWAGEDVARRIIFTDVAPKQQHISRARVCDLFLDTPECNAHTTAADVLWSSTPLLTLPRYPYKMCSRMAASILKGALPKTPRGDEVVQELVASDDDDYEALATKLARSLSYRNVDGRHCEGYGRLADIRRILFEAKWTCALFNTRRWVADLERAYGEAWRRWVAGEGGDIYL
ncbi:hypothetical protein ABKA04_001500 [Annulohypoxylon sp. FPYF3050]